MKILFAKIPGDDVSTRNSYNLDQFIIGNVSLEKYELMFDDIEGFCYTSPYSEEELADRICTFDIKKYFKLDIDVLKDVMIIFFAHTPKGVLLDGWYKDAEIYKMWQEITDYKRAYHFKARAKDAVFIPLYIEINCPIEFEDFAVPSETQAKGIIEFINSYSGEKLNLVFEEVIKNIKVPEYQNDNESIRIVNNIISDENRRPEDIFKAIKIYNELLERGIRTEKIHESLMFSYYWLDQ